VKISFETVCAASPREALRGKNWVENVKHEGESAEWRKSGRRATSRKRFSLPGSFSLAGVIIILALWNCGKLFTSCSHLRCLLRPAGLRLETASRCDKKKP